MVVSERFFIRGVRINVNVLEARKGRGEEKKLCRPSRRFQARLARANCAPKRADSDRQRRMKNAGMQNRGRWRADASLQLTYLHDCRLGPIETHQDNHRIDPALNSEPSVT